MPSALYRIFNHSINGVYTCRFRELRTVYDDKQSKLGGFNSRRI